MIDGSAESLFAARYLAYTVGEVANTTLEQLLNPSLIFVEPRARGTDQISELTHTNIDRYTQTTNCRMTNCESKRCHVTLIIIE